MFASDINDFLIYHVLWTGTKDKRLRKSFVQ